MSRYCVFIMLFTMCTTYLFDSQMHEWHKLSRDNDSLNNINKRTTLYKYRDDMVNSAHVQTSTLV